MEGNGDRKIAEAARDVDMPEMSELQIKSGKALTQKLKESKNFLEALDEYEALHYQK